MADLRRMVEAAGLDPATVTRADLRTLMQRQAASGQALGQPVNVGVDPDRQVGVVDLDPMQGAKRSPFDLVAKLKTILNQPLKTADAKAIAQVLPENVKHITYSGAPVHTHAVQIRNKSVFNLPMLLERAVLIESGPNTKTSKKPDVLDYHRFYVPVLDRGQVKVVRIVAHRTSDGIKIDPDAFDVYDVILENKKGGPHTSGSPYGSPSSAKQGGHPSFITIRQMLAGVKDMGGKPYFQSTDTGPRGQFDPVSNTIRLFQSRDLSTFTHESGHAWLFQMVHDLGDQRLTEAARTRITADLRTVLDWLKVDVDVDAAIASGGPAAILDAIPVEAHEQWARGFEAYVMEGRAPSLALRDVFATMAAWMVRVYRKVRALKVTLNPDIRAVMDRLLAAEDAIAEARAASPHDKVAAALAEVLTPAETRELEMAQERAVREARAEMQGRVMRELARERKAWWKEERAKVEAEVAATLRQRPEWRVLDLARGIAADGSKLDADQAVKLDRAGLVAEYGEDIVKLLPAGVTTLKDGANHHVLAGMLGAADGDGLVKALMAAKATPWRQVLAAETDKIMRERHGSIDSHIAEDAADIVTTARQAEVVALQAKALKRLAAKVLDRAATRQVAKTGAASASDTRAQVEAAEIDTDRVTDAGVPAEGVAAAQAAEQMERAKAKAAVTGRTAQSAAAGQVRAMLARLDHGAIRDAAARIIETRTVRVAVDANPYRASARREARKAEIAIAKRDYQGALEAKQRELLNLELAAQAVKAKEEVAKLAAKAGRLNQPDAKLAKSMDQEFYLAARQVWARYGLARADTAFDVQTWLTRLEAQDPAGHADVSAILARLTSAPNPGRVAVRTLPNGQRVTIAPDYRDLKLEDLRGIADEVSALLAMGRNATSALRDGERQAYADQVAEMAQVAGHLVKDIDLSHATTEREKLAGGLMGLVASGRRVESWCRLMDNGEAGPFTRHIWRPIIAATYAYRQARAGLMVQLRDILAPTLSEYAQPRVIDAPELAGFQFKTKGELIHAILHSGNDSNLKKLVLGWKWGQPTPDGGFDRAPWDAFLNRMYTDGVVTQADMDRVQAVWDLFEQTKTGAQAAMRAMFGHNFREVEHGGVTTPWGRLRGGYVPAITDKGRVDDGARHLDADALASQDNAAMFPAVSKGFTQGRVDYNKPLALDLTAIPGHLDKVLRFSHLGPVVRQIARLTRRADFGALVGGIDRGAIPDMILPWLNRVAAQRVDTPATGAGGRMGDQFFRVLRRTAGLQAMAGNIVNAVQQVTGLSSAAVMVPPRHLADALVRVWRDPGRSLTAIKAKSPLMADRADEAARMVDADIDALLRHQGPLAQAQDWAARHGYFAQVMAQNLVDRVVWAGAYDHGLAQGLTDAEAVLHADAMVRQSQGAFAPEDVARVETGPAALRLFTMFYSYFGGQANMLGTEVALALRNLSGSERGRRLGAIYLMGALIPAVVAEGLVEAARGRLGDEDDDGWADDLAELFVLSQIRYFAAMAPGVGQGINWALNLFNGKPYDDRISVSPAISMIESAGRAASSVPKALFAGGDASRAVSDGINAIGLATGLPLGMIRKPISYAVDVAEGDSRPRHPGNILSGILTGQDGTAR